MIRRYFMKTERIWFSRWTPHDIELAMQLWGEPEVTKFICASGKLAEDEIEKRLAVELANDEQYHIQYWPCFQAATQELIGCCGLRPHQRDEYEIGFHLRPEFWGHGYATEAAGAVIRYAFDQLNAAALFAGHNPNNTASAKVLKKLGFVYIKDEYYAPTGLYHPSYKLLNPAGAAQPVSGVITGFRPGNGIGG